MGTETETPTGTTAQAHIAGDAPFVYLPDTVFKEIYDAPTLLTYGFNVEEALQPQMEEFLSSYVSENTSSVRPHSLGCRPSGVRAQDTDRTP